MGTVAGCVIPPDERESAKPSANFWENTMSKLTNEERSAILSARAKNRKAVIALTNAGVAVPATVAKHMRAVEEWANKALAPAAKKTAKAEAKAA